MDKGLLRKENDKDTDIIGHINNIKAKCNKKYYKIISGIRFEFSFSTNIYDLNVKLLEAHTFYDGEKILDDEIKVYIVKDNTLFDSFNFSNYKSVKQITIYQSHSYNKDKVEMYNIFNTEIFYNYKQKVVYFKNNNEYFLIFRDDTLEIDKHIYRLIRPILIKTYESNGGLVLHSSALKYKGKVILFLGNKKAGKTTLMLKLLSSGDFEYVSNDKVILYYNKESNKMIVLPVPMSIRIGLGTLSGNKKIYNKLKDINFIRTQDKKIVDFLDNYNEKYLKYNNKVEITNLELSTILDINVCYGGELYCIYNPEIKIDEDDIVITSINCDEKKNVLNSNIYSPYDFTWPEEWIIKNSMNYDDFLICIKQNINRINDNFKYKIKYGSNAKLDVLRDIIIGMFDTE